MSANRGPHSPVRVLVLHMLAGVCMACWGCVGTIDDAPALSSAPGGLSELGSAGVPAPGPQSGAPLDSQGESGLPSPQPPSEGERWADGGTGLPTADGGLMAPGSDPCALENLPLAKDIGLDEVAVYQAVKIPLMKAGAEVAQRNAPVIQGRDALVRAFVSPEPAFVQRELVARLSLDNRGEVTEYEAHLSPARPSTDGSLASTFNFQVDGRDLGPSTQYSVSLHDAACSATPGSASDTRFPVDGLSALRAIDTGTLHITLVPIQYSFNGVSFAPDTSAGSVQRMRDAFLRTNPVADVEISVREPFRWGDLVLPDGTGWNQLLNAVLALRDREAASNEYYYGLVAVAPTFREYCVRGCVAGIAPVGRSGGFFGSAQASAGIGVGFDDDASRETAVHEIGHTQSSPHAGCAAGGIDGVDPDYPYDGALIGSWGYDLLTGQLKAPERHADIMSYCEPTWVSDYTYARWARWAEQANRLRANRVLANSSVRWHSLIVDADGGGTQWGTWRPSLPPSGAPETAIVLDALGRQLDEVQIVRMELSHTEGEFLFLPEVGDEWASLQLSDRRVDLRGAKPAATR